MIRTTSLVCATKDIDYQRERMLENGWVNTSYRLASEVHEVVMQFVFCGSRAREIQAEKYSKPIFVRN